MPMILKGKQMDQKFKIIFSYVASLKPVWTTGDCQRGRQRKIVRREEDRLASSCLYNTVLKIPSKRD